MIKPIALLIALSCCVAIAARPSECELPKLVGPCRGMFPSFYFNPGTNRCEQFFYGGCSGRSAHVNHARKNLFGVLGNGNRFETEAACMKSCADASDGTGAK